MAKNNALKKSYQQMIDWNLYRLDQNNKSLSKLNTVLTKLDRTQPANEIYEADISDMESLKIIFETSIRNLDGKIQKYRDLLAEM
jgi:hypothetical protein